MRTFLQCLACKHFISGISRSDKQFFFLLAVEGLGENG